MKLFTLALAALFAGSAMAADYAPTKVFSVGNETTLGAKWAGKGQPANYFVSGDTTIFTPFLCYQSCGVGKQEWTGNTGMGSTSATWEGMKCFKGNMAWGTGDAGNKTATIRSNRIAYYNVTNCLSVLALADLKGSNREMYIKAYEIVNNVVSSEIAKSVTRSEDGIGVLELTGLDAAKVYQIQVLTNTGSNSNFYEVAFVAAPAATNIATLSSITIDGEALEGFDPATETYNVELPFGTTTVPTVAAVATSKKATAVVTPATAIPGATTIAVTAEDGATTKTYTINFTTAASASTDATLSTITIDGKAIAGFKSDSMTYAYEVAYNYEAGKFPVVAAVANDESATIAYTQITAFPGKATILVTAQADNTLTYTIDITKATAPKILSEVVFSNGAKGASLNGVVRVPYLADTEVPTVVSAAAADGATAVVAEDKNSITVTGEDNTTLVYTIETVELALATLGTEEVTFSGEETYIFDPYGWDASKGWKFAKAVEEANNHRVSEGRTRIYMALPAAKEVILTSGTGGARNIKVFVNGVEKTEITSTSKSGETITIALDSKNANFLAVESNQTKGDGGFTKIQLVPAGETDIDNAVVAEKAQKMIINGQLVIVKDGVRYNAQGVQL